MGKLVFLMNVSLDGYIEDAAGTLDWQSADDELLRWFNGQARRADAFLYGRRLYEDMAAFWPTAEADPRTTETMLEWARLWLAKPKIVFSTTLDAVDWNSRLVRSDALGALARLHEEFAGELQVAGPTLARTFIEPDLVDEYRLVVHPAVAGSGKPYWPWLERPRRLELVDVHRFASGVLALTYRRSHAGGASESGLAGTIG